MAIKKIIDVTDQIGLFTESGDFYHTRNGGSRRPIGNESTGSFSLRLGICLAAKNSDPTSDREPTEMIVTRDRVYLR
jgi:hypothetical protein